MPTETVHTTEKTTYILTIVVAVVVGAAAFYGGMQYQKSQTSAPSQFVGMLGQQGAPGQFAGRRDGSDRTAITGNRMFGGGITGEILSQDDTTMTVKAPNGSSKIVLFTDKTTFNTASAAAKTDLTLGQTVSVFGTPNADGSVTASTVQLNASTMERPELPAN